MSYSLEPLVLLHRRLDALFQAHQEALVGLEVARAQESLRLFERALVEHVDFETARILPVFAKLPRIRGSGLEFFTGEHEKLLALLAEVRAIVEPLRPEQPDLRTRIVESFDRAALFKGLMEHHDLREGQLLYPRLAETITAEEARALVAACPVPPDVPT